ncbi:MAG: hypothetical protein ACRD8U_14545 [Pyrinomonadaceae bacterium]
MAKIANNVSAPRRKACHQVDQLTAAPTLFKGTSSPGRGGLLTSSLEHLKRLLEIAPRSAFREILFGAQRRHLLRNRGADQAVQGYPLGFASFLTSSINDG